jgi:hypothetical protein
LGKSVRKFQAQRGLEEAGTDGQWSKESDWKEIPKTKSGRPVDPRGEVTHLSDVARREAERKAAQKKNPEKVAEEGSRPRDLAAAVMLKKARAAFPIAGNDAEALALYIADKEQRDVNRLERENDEEDALIARIMDQLKKTEVSEGDVNPKFIIAQVTRLLATEARRMTNAPMAQLLAPVMKEYGLSLQQIDAMVPGGLRKAAGEYGIMMKESSWGGSGPAGLKTPYAVYTKQNGQVKRVKTTNKIGQPMNTREAEAYVAAMRKSDPARWTHDTVWVAPADIDLDEAVNEKGALKAAQQAAEFIITNLDDRAALKDYSLHFWSPAKFYQGATRAMRGAGVDEIAKHIIQDRPAEFPKNQNEAANPVAEEKTRLDPKCWTGKKIGTPKTKMKGGVRVNNCVPAEESYTGVMESQGITDPKLLEVARRIDAFAKTIK